MYGVNLPENDYSWTLVMAAILALIPLLFLETTTYLRVYNRFLIFALIAIGLNIVFGHTDQLFLFMGALAALAAYIMAIMSQEVLGLTAWLTLPLGIFVAGLVGAVVSWISARRKLGVILISILTLNLQLAFLEAYTGLRNITGGSTGYDFAQRSILGLADVGTAIGINRFAAQTYLLITLVTLSLFLYIWMIEGKYGLAFEAIREDNLAASSIGIDVVRYKTIAGFVGAVLIGLGGVMIAEFQGVVLPGDYEFARIDVLVLIMLIIGGLRTTFGPVIGAAVVFILGELLQPIGQWETAVFGALLIVLFLYYREGIMPVIVDWAKQANERIKEKRGSDTGG